MPATSSASGAWYRPTLRTMRPNIGDHTLFSIMTTEPNGIVEPIHEKAMPVMLMTPDEVEKWLRGSSVEYALKMQKPATRRCDCDAALRKESGLAPSINLATGSSPPSV